MWRSRVAGREALPARGKKGGTAGISSSRPFGDGSFFVTEGKVNFTMWYDLEVE